VQKLPGWPLKNQLLKEKLTANLCSGMKSFSVNLKKIPQTEMPGILQFELNK
jgi:hypothetical protein